MNTLLKTGYITHALLLILNRLLDTFTSTNQKLNTKYSYNADLTHIISMLVCILSV